MNKALRNADIATGHTGGRARDWRKAMSDNVALALLVYTGMQIFMTVGAMKQGVSPILRSSSWWPGSFLPAAGSSGAGRTCPTTRQPTER